MSDSDDSSIEDAEEPVFAESVYSDLESDDSRENQKTKPKGSFFTLEEDHAIIDYLADGKRYKLTGGNAVWKDAVKEDICPGRSFWSLKERFKRCILRNLEKYDVDEDLKRMLKKEENDEEMDETGNSADNQRQFTKEEDQTLINFFIENNEYFQTNGHQLWLLAEEHKLCPGRSWWYMRDRFLKFIIPNIGLYKCDEKSTAKIKKAGDILYDRISEMPKNYIIEEDLAIIKYVTQGDRYLQVKGLDIWKKAENIRLCPCRSYWSMQERFRKVILPNFTRYALDDQQKEKFRFIANATAEEIAQKRQQSHVQKVLKGSPGESPYRRSTRFHYPEIKDQRTLESPMGSVNETPKIGKKLSPKIKNHRNKSPSQSPEPCSSKDLTPIKISKLGKWKSVNSSPERTYENTSKNVEEDKSSAEIEAETKSKRSDYHTKTKIKKIIPFFEQMREDEQKNKMVVSTPKNAPAANTSNRKPITRSITSPKSKQLKKKQDDPLLPLRPLIKKLKSAKEKG